MEEREGGVVEAKEFQQSSVEVANGDFVFGGAEADGVGCAVGQAAADGSAGVLVPQSQGK